jgi:hypothetical protein
MASIKNNRFFGCGLIFGGRITKMPDHRMTLIFGGNTA